MGIGSPALVDRNERRSATKERVISNTAVLFPGQGAQKVGMGADFVESSTAARKLFELADDVLERSLSRLCFEGPHEELTLTHNCQPAIFATSAAIVAAVEEAGRLSRDEVVASAGLSLGEYTALWFAGALSFEDGLRLVAKRGELMQRASDDPPSGMVSLLGADEEKAHSIAEEAAQGDVLVVANLLSPGQVVLSGAQAACARVPGIAKTHGVRRAIPLSVAGAFHSPLMKSAADALAEELTRVDVRTPAFPVVGNVTGKPMTDPDEIRLRLAAQVVEPVRWQQGMEGLAASGTQRIVEPGPGRVLAGLMKKIDKSIEARNFDSAEALDTSDGEN